MTRHKAPITWMGPLLLGLALIAPGTGLAQTGLRLLDDATVPSPEPEEGPRLLELPPVPADTASPAAPLVRVAAEVGAMSLTSSFAAIPGLLMGLALCDGESGPFGLGCADSAMFGALGGMMIGAPLGVWSGGQLAGGQGTLSGAFAGAAVGAGAGFATAYLVPDKDLQPYIITVVPLIGALVGYELSHAANSRREQAPAVSVQPTLAMGPEHTLLGMSGQF